MSSSMANSLLLLRSSPFQSPNPRLLSYLSSSNTTTTTGFRKKKLFPIFSRFNGNDEAFRESLRVYVESRKNETTTKSLLLQNSLPTNYQMMSWENRSKSTINEMTRMKLTSHQQQQPHIYPLSLHSSIVKSISSFTVMIDHLLNYIIQQQQQDSTNNNHSRQMMMSHSLVLLFDKICHLNIFMSILILLADFIVFNFPLSAAQDYGGLCQEEEELEPPVKLLRNEEDFDKTTSYYERLILENPNNSMILSNYAQFLYLNMKDYDRAEEMFELAIQMEPRDAEALSRYATFMVDRKRDIEAAEENYLAAIELDPTNSTHKSNYALFLLNTGGVDTCYPLYPST